MPRVGIIYETTDREGEAAIQKLSMVVGASKYFKTDEFTIDLKDTYDFYVIGGPVVNGVIDKRVTNFVTQHRDWLLSMRVGLLAICEHKIQWEDALSTLVDMLGNAVVTKERITVESGRYNVEQIVNVGLRLKEFKEKAYPSLPPDELKDHVEKFLGSRKYCILCTGYGDRVRGTAVNYTYHEGHIYIYCEGATKYANILLNDNVCIALHAPYKRSSRQAGIQLTGKVRQIAHPSSEEYRRIAEIRGSDYHRLSTLPWNLWALDIEIEKAEFWWEQWREMGVGAKQTYYFRPPSP